MGCSIQAPGVEPLKNWAGTAWAYERRRFEDVTEQTKSAEGWQIVCNQLGRGRYAARSDSLTVGRITITRDWIDLPVGQHTQSPAGRVSLFFPLRSEDGWRVDGRCETRDVVAMRQGPTELLIAPGSRSELLHVEMPADLVGLDGTLSIVQSRAIRPADAALRDWLLCLLEQAEAGIVRDAAETAALEDILLMRLLPCMAGFSLIPSDTIHRSAAIDLLSRVERSLGEVEDIPGTVGALCRRQSLGSNELSSATHAAFGQSPELWYRIVRLNGVHRDLRARSKGLTVTRAATRWGFFHLGRFSGDYATFFGRHPRESLKAN